MGKAAKRIQAAAPRRRSADSRRTFFERYAQNVEWYAPGLHGVFVCPLCFNEFSPDALMDPPQVTLEHVIPDKLGGRIITLTCQECNSQHGKLLDVQLINWLEMVDDMTGISGRPVRGKLQTEQGEMAADLLLSAHLHEVFIQLHPELSNPIKYKQALEDVQKPSGKLRFTRPLGFKPEAANIALLRIAYVTTQPIRWYSATT